MRSSCIRLCYLLFNKVPRQIVITNIQSSRYNQTTCQSQDGSAVHLHLVKWIRLSVRNENPISYRRSQCKAGNVNDSTQACAWGSEQKIIVCSNNYLGSSTMLNLITTHAVRMGVLCTLYYALIMKSICPCPLVTGHCTFGSFYLLSFKGRLGRGECFSFSQDLLSCFLFLETRQKRIDDSFPLPGALSNGQLRPVYTEYLGR